MTIESRIVTARAALADMGRSDLANSILDADETRARYPTIDPPPLSWWYFHVDDRTIDDEVLLRRAAAIAALSEGYDDRNYYCETCIRIRPNPDCTLVTRREFLAHQSCTLHEAVSQRVGQ